MTDIKEPMRYHWLFAAQVVFKIEDAKPNQEDRGAILLNGILTTENAHVAVADMARAQNTAIANFNARMKDEKMKVIDVVFMSMNNIGLMSKTIFQQAKPEDSAVVATAANE